MADDCGQLSTAAPPVGPVGGGEPTSRYGWRVLTATSIGVLLVFVNSTSLDVALPAVTRALNASSIQATWFLLSYMLVNTILILVFGRLADLIGRRTLYLCGLAGMAVTSLLCGLATSPDMLIAYRAAQGVTAALVVTNTTAILSESFPARSLSLGLGANASVAAAGQVIGPLVGGIFVTHVNWRWLFIVNVPIALAGLCWSWATVRRPEAPRRAEPFDYVGTALLTTWLGGLVLAVSQAGEEPPTSPAVLAPAAAFAAGLTVFVIWEGRQAHPLLDLWLLRDRNRGAGYTACLLMSVSQFSVVLLASLYLQIVRGMSAFEAGGHVVAMAVGITLAAPVAGRLSRRYSSRLLSTIGMTIIGLAAAVLAATMSTPTLLVTLFFIGLGTGLFMTPNTTDLVAGLPPARRGVGNGLRVTLQNVGFALSTALSLALITSGLNPGDRSSAYAGRLRSLPHAELGHFVHGERLALAVLAGFAVIGVAASLSRASRRHAQPQPEPAAPGQPDTAAT